MVPMADRLGLMVWSEIPVYQGIDFKNPQTLAKAQQQLTEVIARDRNRAAIIVWSVSNETPKSAERNAFLHQLIVMARALDPTRLITTATDQTSATEAHLDHVLQQADDRERVRRRCKAGARRRFSAMDWGISGGYLQAYNRKGLISESGERKKAFYVLQKFYRELAAQTGTTAQ